VEEREMLKLTSLLYRVMCWLGFHDFRVIDRTFGFGAGGDVEKLQCKRCGIIIIRQT